MTHEADGKAKNLVKYSHARSGRHEIFLIAVVFVRSDVRSPRPKDYNPDIKNVTSVRKILYVRKCHWPRKSCSRETSEADAMNAQKSEKSRSLTLTKVRQRVPRKFISPKCASISHVIIRVSYYFPDFSFISEFSAHTPRDIYGK